MRSARCRLWPLPQHLLHGEHLVQHRLFRTVAAVVPAAAREPSAVGCRRAGHALMCTGESSMGTGRVQWAVAALAMPACWR